MKNNKYKIILEDINRQIESGILQAGDMLPTENEFMERYQVSRTTIQRAMGILVNEGKIYRVSGSGTFVSQDVAGKTKLEDGSFSGGNYAMILPYHSAIIMKYLVGAQTYFNRHSASLSVYFSDYTYQSEVRLLTRLAENKVDGVIIYPHDSCDAQRFYGRLAMEGKNVVLIDKQITGVSLCSVTSDNYRGGGRVAKWLLQRGYRRFACVSGNFKEGNSLVERFQGFSDILRLNNIELKEEDTLILPENTSIQNSELLKYFEEFDSREPVAVFCTSDILAVEVCRKALECGIRIPEEMAVIGYDDLEIASMIDPPLTTVEQPYSKIGEAAAELLMKQKNQPEYSCIHLQLPVAIIERSSVGRLSGKAS